MLSIKKYYLFEKNAHGGNSYKKYTFEELKNFFNPDEEVAPEEEVKTFEKIKDIADLEDYINSYINDNDGIHYHDYYIEEA